MAGAAHNRETGAVNKYYPTAYGFLINPPVNSGFRTILAWVKPIKCPPLNGIQIDPDPEAATYCYQTLLAQLYKNSLQNTSVNLIIQLLAHLCWPKVVAPFINKPFVSKLAYFWSIKISKN